MLSCIHHVPTTGSSTAWPADGKSRLTAIPIGKPGSGFLSTLPAASTEAEGEDSPTGQAGVEDIIAVGSADSQASAEQSAEDFQVEFQKDTEHWAHVVGSYWSQLGLNWSSVRNVMDLNARYGG